MLTIGSGNILYSSIIMRMLRNLFKRLKVGGIRLLFKSIGNFNNSKNQSLA
jgi:hypothetical protein